MPPPINIPQPRAGTDDTGDAKDKVTKGSFITYAFGVAMFIICTAIPALFIWGGKQYDKGVGDGAADKAKIVQQYYENWQLERAERSQVQRDKDSLQALINKMQSDENRKQFEIFKMKLNSSGGTKVITIKPQS